MALRAPFLGFYNIETVRPLFSPRYAVASMGRGRVPLLWPNYSIVAHAESIHIVHKYSIGDCANYVHCAQRG